MILWREQKASCGAGLRPVSTPRDTLMTQRPVPMPLRCRRRSCRRSGWHRAPRTISPRAASRTPPCRAAGATPARQGLEMKSAPAFSGASSMNTRSTRLAVHRFIVDRLFSSRTKTPVMVLASVMRPWGMAMPVPTPVVPRRSRSTRVSKMRRSDRRDQAVRARAASSCSNCLLELRFHPCDERHRARADRRCSSTDPCPPENRPHTGRGGVIRLPRLRGSAQKRRVHRPGASAMSILT